MRLHGAGAINCAVYRPLSHNLRMQRKKPAAAGSGERFRQGKWRSAFALNVRFCAVPQVYSHSRRTTVIRGGCVKTQIYFMLTHSLGGFIKVVSRD